MQLNEFVISANGDLSGIPWWNGKTNADLGFIVYYIRTIIIECLPPLLCVVCFACGMAPAIVAVNCFQIIKQTKTQLNWCNMIAERHANTSKL